MARQTAPGIRTGPAEAAILALLAERAAESTLCPSEVARRLDPVAWRTRMDEVRDAAAALVAAGRVRILQRGKPVSGVTRGPIRIGHAPAESAGPLVTPDGRYIVVKGRLWRRANPNRPAATRQRWVDALMDARRDVARGKRSGDAEAIAEARRRVQAAKVALGERGPVWWTDGAPDENRHMAKNTRYADWFAALSHDDS